ncbi:LOB domain-containing protein 41 [Cryptomeria japonica]|uniref:LOB domain-containing protein 41 n=1 Tax=Cryptomeria japonica TaxID=3369 RepID=UPI0025AC08EF|nr:LOB domain-containing protein 41 [Cryptomeria japonica]
MRMSCNGCRVLRKGCNENCSIRPCLEWIKNAESQANATVFLAKFYGRAGLTSLINAGPQHLRPAIFRSLLYEACGRMVNPIYGAVGLLWSGNWQTCQAAVESILKGCPIHPIAPAEAFTSPGAQITEQANNKTNLLPPSALMQSIANELHKVKTKGRFKHPKKASKLPKDIAHIISDAEAASEVCNLQWGRGYPGEEDAHHCLVSSDSSSESEHNCNDVRKSRAEFEPETDLCTPQAKDLITQQELPHTECESDLELELTLCCHSPILKQSNIPCL